MSIIVFTKLERGPVTHRRYGDFTITASKKDVTINGGMKMMGPEHGDLEVIEIIKELLASFREDRVALGGEKDPDGPATIAVARGRGIDKKLGDVVGYLGSGFKAKLCDQWTTIDCQGLVLVSAADLEVLRVQLNRILSDRITLRIEKKKDATDAEP